MKQFLAIFVLGLTLVLAQAGNVYAAPNAVFTVNQTVDLADANIGDGRCDAILALAGDQCSLRAAIQEANSTRAADTINFASSATHTLTRSGQDNVASVGDLDVKSPLVIEGRLPATIIDGGQLDRVFHVLGSETATFKNLTIRGGKLIASTLDGAVSAGVQGTDGDLNFENVTLTDNQIQQANIDFGCCAGVSDISCTCNVSLVNSALTSTNDKGIVANSVTMTASSILNHGNVALTVRSGTSTLTRVIIRGNRGGVSNQGGTLLIQDSEISDGIPGIDLQPPLLPGNGVRNEGALAETHIVNSTISNNHALDGGGGIANLGGTVNLFNVTIANNSTTANGGGIFNQGGVISARNTSIAQNSDTLNPVHADCSGTLTSNGFNLIGNPTGCTINGTTTGNLLNVNPLIGALAKNGGSTQTHALLANSPAIDAGDPAGCAGAHGQILPTDQRSFTRPTDGDGDRIVRCDIGAFEVGAVGIGTISPNKGSSQSGEQVVFDVAWDSPTRWRDLQTVDLRFKRGKEIILWLRFTEGLPKSTFSILDKNGNVLDSGNAGDAKILKNKFGALDLSQSGFTASGPNDPHVVLHYAVKFKKSAEGKLKMQMLATDDFANEQGPEPGGKWKVKQ